MNAGNSTQVMTAAVRYAQPSSPDAGLLAELPRRSWLDLGAYDTAPRTARGHIARVLEEWSLHEYSDVVTLIATEMITNSVLETAKFTWTELPPVRLWLRGGPTGLAVLIWDAVAAPPVPRGAGPGDEAGRGLTIVAELSAACGYYPATLPGGTLAGKVTWALITTP